MYVQYLFVWRQNWQYILRMDIYQFTTKQDPRLQCPNERLHQGPHWQPLTDMKNAPSFWKLFFWELLDVLSKF